MTKPIDYKLPKGFASIKEYRKQVSVLKRKGLIDKSVDARKILPSSNTTRALRQFAPVIEGRQSVYAIKGNKKERTATAKRLREEDKYTVYKGRVIVSKKEILKKGRIYSRGAGLASSRVKFSDLEGAIENAFDKHPGKFLAMQVYGSPVVYAFADTESVMEYVLNNYDPRIDEETEGAFSFQMMDDAGVKAMAKRAEAYRVKALEVSRKKYRKKRAKNRKPGKDSAA